MRYIALALAWSLITAAHGAEPEQVEKIAASFDVSDSVGYFVLSDGTIWRVISAGEHTPDFLESFGGEQLLPEAYRTDTREWVRDADIELYPIESLPQSIDIGSPSRDLVPEATHIVVDIESGKALFAQRLPLIDGLAMVAKESRLAGVQEGCFTRLDRRESRPL